MKDIKIFKSCQSYTDKTWDLDVYCKATGSSLLKLLSHENKGAKVEIGFVIQVGTGRISKQLAGCFSVSPWIKGTWMFS